LAGAAGRSSLAERRIPGPPSKGTDVPRDATPATARTLGPAVVHVDNLPHAPTKKGRGRIAINVPYGTCAVLVLDGQRQAAAPAPSVPVEAAIGRHSVRCIAPGGRVRSANVVVAEGKTAEPRFE
jgi:hypothetical protein